MLALVDKKSIFNFQTDKFVFEIVDLKDLTHLILSHDGRGHGAGIFVDKVVVMEKDTERSHIHHVFPCGRWLDTHEDDCVTERTLHRIGWLLCFVAVKFPLLMSVIALRFCNG